MPAVLVIGPQGAREQAARWVQVAPAGTRIEFKKPVRSLPQNDKLWAMLTELSQQLEWHGQKLTPDDWKDVLTAGLKRELRMVPNADNDGFVMLGMRTSRMSKEELSELLEFVAAFGARHQVTFRDPGPTPTTPDPLTVEADEDLTKAAGNDVFNWAGRFEIRLKNARSRDVPEIWGAAHRGGQLEAVKGCSAARYEQLQAIMRERAQETAA